MEALYTAGKNVKWCSCYGRHFKKSNRRVVLVVQQTNPSKCGVSIPCGCWFESQLIHFQPSSLLRCLRKQMMAQVSGPLQLMLTWMKLLLSTWPGPGQPLWSFGEYTSRRKVFSVSLFQINKSLRG